MPYQPPSYSTLAALGHLNDTEKLNYLRQGKRPEPFKRYTPGFDRTFPTATIAPSVAVPPSKITPVAPLDLGKLYRILDDTPEPKQQKDFSSQVLDYARSPEYKRFLEDEVQRTRRVDSNKGYINLLNDDLKGLNNIRTAIFGKSFGGF